MVHRTVLILLTIFLFWSCQKDEVKCVAPAFNANIIGKWSAHWYSSAEKICNVEFRKDGSYVEDKDLLLGDYFLPVAIWSANQDSLTVSAKYSNASTSTYAFSVLENNCNEIVLDLEGLEKVKLTRK